MPGFPRREDFFFGVDRVQDITLASTLPVAGDLTPLVKDGQWAFATATDGNLFLAAAQTQAGSLTKYTFAGSIV